MTSNMLIIDIPDCAACDKPVTDIMAKGSPMERTTEHGLVRWRICYACCCLPRAERVEWEERVERRVLAAFGPVTGRA